MSKHLQHVGSGRARRAGERMTGRRQLAACSAVLWTLLAGCSSEPVHKFDRLDLVPAQEELMEFSLGKYAVPIPLKYEGGHGDSRPANLLQFDFELFAVIKREQQSRIADAWSRHEGKIRDRVIRVCRNATLDELQEFGWAALKAHLMDAVQAQLGEKEVRQLSIAEVKSRSI